MRGFRIKIMLLAVVCFAGLFTASACTVTRDGSLQNMLDEIVNIRKGCMANAEPDVWIYELLEDGTLSLGGCTEQVLNGELVLPGEIDGYAVTAIGENSFSGQGITSLVIPEGVERIGSNAFKLCAKLSSVSLPASLKKIDGGAFAYCESLPEAGLPDGVEAVGSSAFYYCTALESVTLPESLTEISDNMLGECWSLSELQIPSGVTDIGLGAFFRCYSLTELTLPEKVKNVRSAAFADCKSLERLTVLSPQVEFGEELLLGSYEDLIIVGAADSAAEQYARAEGIRFEPLVSEQ